MQGHIGKLTLIDRPAIESDTNQSNSSKTACSLLALDAAQLKSGSAVVFALCRSRPSAERTFALAKGLLDLISADFIVVESSLPVGAFSCHPGFPQAAAAMQSISIQIGHVLHKLSLCIKHIALT